LRRIKPGAIDIANGFCEDNGHFVHPISDGTGVVRGLYEVRFGVAAYYSRSGVELPEPAFVTDAVFEFGIDRVSEHFHLPFKFTPWGFSLFRGGS
jgi:5-hydroxyisourate hydrolase